MTDTLAIELYKSALTFAYTTVGRENEHVWMSVVAGKYSELIVAECAKICRDHGASAEHSYAPSKFLVAQRTAEGCATLIERKFKLK